MAWKCSRRFDGCFLLARGPGAVQVVVGRLGAARKKRWWCADKALGRPRGRSIVAVDGRHDGESKRSALHYLPVHNTTHYP